MTTTTSDTGYILVLGPGDELLHSLIRFAREQELDSALVVGIGTVSELELGTGHDPRRTHFTEALELCSLTGTVTLVDGEPFPHLHGTFARADHSVLGGHIFQAVCHTALELSVQPQYTATSYARTARALAS